ncbi:MAG: nuclear transport factor 2 family protein [Lysobacteraceae bacterium]|nr:MAG: nuclear transport factor 2 family protein [Xanthomonadaceae bacterium]
MGHGTLAAAIAIMLAGVTASSAVAIGDDGARVIEIDRRMQRAFVDRDLATLRGILTDDYVLVASTGEERTRDTVIAEVASPDVRWEVNEARGATVRVHGDTAVLVANLRQKGIDHGKPFDRSVKFSTTWIRVGHVWRNVHAHASREVELQPPPPRATEKSITAL